MKDLSNLLDNALIERLVWIVAGLLVVALLRYYVIRLLNKGIQNTDNKYRARKAVNFTSSFFLLAVVLFVFSDKLGNLGVALGVVGAGIAFALQEVIISIAGWLNIVITGSLGVGQRVKIGEVKGDIIDIGVMNTTIMELGDWVNGDLYNGSIVTMANSFVYKEKIKNYSAEYPFLWDELEVPIRAESDHNKAREVFKRVLEEICGDFASESTKHWDRMTNKFRIEEAQVQPMVTLEFNEEWITFTLRYIVDYKKRRTTKDLIYSRLLEEIRTEPKISIAASALEVTNMNEGN